MILVLYISLMVNKGAYKLEDINEKDMFTYTHTHAHMDIHPRDI
jgi:hypothetical protein